MDKNYNIDIEFNQFKFTIKFYKYVKYNKIAVKIVAMNPVFLRKLKFQKSKTNFHAQINYC